LYPGVIKSTSLVVGLKGRFPLGSVQAREFFIMLITEADPSRDADRLWRVRSQAP